MIFLIVNLVLIVFFAGWCLGKWMVQNEIEGIGVGARAS